MERLYFNKWDNYDESSPKRMDAVNEVIEAVEEHGEVAISFDYEGRTRHEIAAHVMADMLPKEYKKEIGYNYKFIVRK